MCLLMIFIGGVTRLSDAGLSIVEWRPITGILPPLSTDAWVDEFTKYQSSPEYRIVNHSMTLDEFKKIFLIEFIHRIAARITGIVACLPLLYFYISGSLPFRSNKSYLFMPILLLSQGVMGWYMVKSGLKFEPHVSHFRLSCHLILAVALYSFIIWKLLDASVHKFSTLGIITSITIYIQIFLGGLVAGLNAGLVYNTFPLMGDAFIPREFVLSNAIDIWYDPVSVQFLHRIMAYIVTICVLSFACSLRRSNPRIASFIVFSVIIQIATGIGTLIFVVPMSLALVHQICAMMLLTSVLIGVKHSNKHLTNALS